MWAARLIALGIQACVSFKKCCYFLASVPELSKCRSFTEMNGEDVFSDVARLLV